MVQVLVGKWGNNLAVRLPSEIVETARLQEGERVDVISEGGDIVIRRADPELALAALFRGKSAEEWRAAYAGAFDWGPEAGREIVPE